MGATVVHLMAVGVLTLAGYFEFAEWRKRRNHRNRAIKPPKPIAVQRPR
jgi:hypothetical protein